jgi:16S rRNA (adenine1518-N6/adenine1519-N6)-dimethyltransferase
MNQKLFNPDYLLHLCSKYGLKPSKKYGQNFLIEEEVINEIIEQAELTGAETVVEVGPGLGTLTFALAQNAQQVKSFEIEKKLQPYWEEQQKNIKNLEIIWGNVLKEFPKRAAEMGEYVVVANVPYQISSPLLRMFLESTRPPRFMLLMLQKEVVERICAKPGDLSLLALAVQLYAEPVMVASVPRSAFWPAPAVDSAIVYIKPRLRQGFGGQAREIEQIFKVAKAGFSSRRKLLLKNLKPLFKNRAQEPLEAIFERLKLSKTARAQELSVTDWENLAKALN